MVYSSDYFIGLKNVPLVPMLNFLGSVTDCTTDFERAFLRKLARMLEKSA